MKEIIAFDRSFFRLINSEWQNPFFDWLMPVVRIPAMWTPLYIFMLCMILGNVRKHSWLLILFAIITIVVTDQVSSTLIKHNIHRLRPCADEVIAAWRRAMIGCPINSSFTSSHAANHFAIATFFFLTLKQYFGKPMYLFFLWALLVSYAQVYVGVHYPFDVIAGGITGATLGCLTASIYKWTVRKLEERNDIPVNRQIDG